MGGVNRVLMRKFLSLSAFFALGLLPVARPLFAQQTEVTLDKKVAESAPSLPESAKTTGKKIPESAPSFSEDIVMPEAMPTMPGGFTGEEKTSALGPQPEVPLSEGPRLSIADCVQLALLNNREVRAKDYDIEAAQNKLKEAQPRGIPVFEYEFLSFPAPRDADHAVSSFFEGNVTFGQRGKISLGIPLYTFGKIGIAQELARYGIASEREKKVDK